MQTAKLNTILANSNTTCRDLTNIDIAIIASAMVKVWKESNMNCPIPPISPIPPVPFVNLEIRKNQYIKILINIISKLRGASNLDNMFNLITGLTDNFNYINNLQIEEIYLNNVGHFNNVDISNFTPLLNIKLSSLNKMLYDKTYIFYKNYFDNDEQENITNTNNYGIFLNEILKKNPISKSDFASIYLGLRTFSKIITNNVNINKEKIIEKLSIEYHISNNDFLQCLHRIFVKISNNVNVNLENEDINYKVVYEVINWCI